MALLSAGILHAHKIPHFGGEVGFFGKGGGLAFRGPNWGLFFVPACPPLTAINGYERPFLCLNSTILAEIITNVILKTNFSVRLPLTNLQIIPGHKFFGIGNLFLPTQILGNVFTDLIRNPDFLPI